MNRRLSALFLAAGLWSSVAGAAGAGEKPLSVADEQYRLAGALFARGEFARAAATYASFARRHRRDPRAGEAHFRSAEGLYRAGESKKARKAFEKCLTLKLPAARLAAARLRIGSISYAAGDAEGAAAALSKVDMKRLPAEARRAAAYFLGASLLELGRKKEAGPHLAQAAGSKQAALAAPALLELARMESEAGRRAGAAGHLGKLLKRFPGAPEAAEAGFRLAEITRLRGKPAAALALYAAVLKRSPPGELAARAALGAAWCHLAGNDARGALKMASMAARAPKLATESRYVTGLARMAAKKYAEAEAAFAGILKLAPRGPRAESAACRLVWCRHLAGRGAQVGPAAREFRARFPKSKLAGEVAHVEGLAAAAGGDVEGALAALDKAAADPKSRYAAESAYRAALLCSEKGRPKQARARLERLVRLHAKHRLADAALVRLGELALGAGDAKGAAKHFDTHLASFPASKLRPAALLGRALAAAAAKDWTGFQQRCAQLARARPGDPAGVEASYWLAWNYERLKTYDQATAAYVRLIAKYRKPPLVYEFKFRLSCAYYLNGNYPKAAEGFLALARSGKRRLPAEGLLWLGQYLGGQGRDKEAAEVYALAAGSKDPATRAEALLALGHQALRGGRAAGAVVLYRKLLAEIPKSVRADDARLGLVRALRESGKAAEARKIAAGLVTSKNERLRLAARGELALADLAVGKAAEAVAGLAPLATLYDDSELVPRWLAGLAAAEEKLKRKAAATRWYRELITRYPASREAKAASAKTKIPLPEPSSKTGEKF